MQKSSFRIEAERCRSLAKSYTGAPEGALLLRLADEFDALSSDARSSPLRAISSESHAKSEHRQPVPF